VPGILGLRLSDRTGSKSAIFRCGRCEVTKGMAEYRGRDWTGVTGDWGLDWSYWGLGDRAFGLWDWASRLKLLVGP
jgi:hypothetical protein